MYKGIVIALLVAVFGALALARAEEPAHVLVSQDEFAADQAARDRPADGGRTAGELFDEQAWARSVDAPIIEVLSPDVTRGVPAPVDVDIRFRPVPGTMIASHTVRVRYGVTGLDITERLRNMGSVTHEGIRARGATLPPGEHIFSVQAEDTKGNRARHRFTLRIVE